MTTVAKLSADLTANTGQFEAGLKRATSALNSNKNSWNRSLKDAEGGFDSLRKKLNSTVGGFFSLRGAIATILGGAGLAAITKSSLEAADGISKLSDKLGLNTTETQRYIYAAKLAGIESETFETAIAKLNSQIAAGKLPYKTTGEAINAIADRVKNATTNIERARIVNEAFGAKLGARLIPMLQNGSAGLKAFGDEAERLGLILDEKTVRGAEKFKDQLEILGLVISRNFQQGFLGNFINESGKLREIYSDGRFVEGIKSVADALGSFVAFILRYLPEATTVLATFAGAASGAALGGAAGSVVPGIGTALGAAGGAIVGGVGAFGVTAAATNVPSRAFASGGVKGKEIKDQREINDLLLENQRIMENGIVLVDKTASVNTESFEKQQEAAKKAAASIKDIIADVTEESEKVKLNVDLYDKKAGAIKRAQLEQAIANRLQREGLKLTEAEKDIIQQKLAAIEQEGNAYEELEKAKKAADEAEKQRQQALQQYGFAFQSAFEDAILAGNRLSDVLQGLANDIARIALRSAVTQPLGSWFGGLFSSGGFFSSLLPSFDVGSFNVPSDMVANIHKGEMIIPAAEASAIRSGQGGGGGNFNANIVVNSQGGSDSGKDVAIAVEKQLDKWWDVKMRNSMRPGNILNPVF